ncbi:MAG: hypothetical protein M1503_07755 [Thaumarchaeota archaeon]|nr:hypothetical protein [Nitrososphaerota archaeon]
MVGTADVVVEVSVDADDDDCVGLPVKGCGCERKISVRATAINAVKITRRIVDLYLLLLLTFKLVA